MVAEWTAHGALVTPAAPASKLPGQASEDFERLDELWNNVWSGDVCLPTAPPTLRRRSVGLSEWSSDPALAIRSRSDIGYRHPLNVLDNGEAPGAGLGKSASCSALRYGTKANRGLLRRMKSWMDKLHDRRRGIVYSDKGPCQLFSDWGIPPYPEDYDWNEQ